MAGRRLRRGLGGGAADTDETAGTGTVDDLVPKADQTTVQEFFRVTSGDLPFAAGEAPPIPRPYLGMPRMAVTINLNYVWDDTAQEWVRQGPFSGGGGGGIAWTFDFVVRNTDTSDVTVTTASTLQAVENNTGSVITVNLPTSPSDNDTVAVINSINSGSQLDISAPSPDEIQGFDFDSSLAVGGGTRLWYDADNGQWWQMT